MRTAATARRAPWWLAGATLVVGIALAVPIVAVVYQALSAGWAVVHRTLSGHLLPMLMTHTLLLTTIVSGACGCVGLGTAWLVERTDLPFRRTFAVLLLLPLAIPEFVAGYAWVSIAPSIHGLSGASLVMTLSLYPLVYLPVAATLRRSDPALDEVARSLGTGPVARFFRVTLPSLARPLVGGMLLVGLYLLAEYGAFAILRYQTFATAIYNAYSLGFDAQAANVLTLVLVLIGVIFLMGESRVGRSSFTGRESGRPPARARLGVVGRAVAFVMMLGLCVLAIGVPIGSIIHWMVVGTSTTLPSASVYGITLRSLTLGGIAAIVATALALPVAVLSVRHSGTLSATVERSAFLDRALPGIAIGLTLVTITVHHLRPLYQTQTLLEFAYVLLFFPLALVAVRAAVARVPPGLDEAARSLGSSPVRVLRRVTIPLVLPGLAAAATLVWLSATTELTATLLLRPSGLRTLATQFWLYTTNLSYGAAAPYAAIMIAVSIVPVVVLARMARGSVGRSTRSRAPMGSSAL
jgi:iron(III) transport system permease protein